VFLRFSILFYPQKRIQRCSTGPVGIEDSADGSAMLRNIPSVITVVLEDTGRPAKIPLSDSSELCVVCTFITKEAVRNSGWTVLLFRCCAMRS